MGVSVTTLGMADVLRAVEQMWRGGGAHQIATVNAEILVRARRDARYGAALAGCALATVDGTLPALALRYLNRRPVERVTGADLIVPLCRLAAARGLPVYLLGAAPGVAERAADRLRRQAPGVVIAGAVSGSPEPAADAGTVRLVRDGGARLLFVAFGAPAQELWIARNLPSLGPCVAIGVGGAFDYLAGRVRRAPRWMRRAGLEWLYRLVRQPWRWRRQLALPLFVYLVLKERFAPRRGSAL